MNYIMTGGALYRDRESVPLARIKSSMLGPVKKICLQGDEPALQTDIQYTNDPGRQPGDVRHHLYVVTDRENRCLASAQPGYAEGEAPETASWPLNRLPRVDHACVRLRGEDHRLVMRSSKAYALLDKDGNERLRITHRSLGGGWLFEDKLSLEPGILCSLFIFCRYLEQENEFLVV